MNTKIFIHNASLLCKAKTYDGEWVIGYYTPEHSPQGDTVFNEIRFQNKKGSHEYSTVETVLVYRKTICRCIGISDINKQFIFENDYVKHFNSAYGRIIEDTFEIGRVYFDTSDLSWKRTVEYTQEYGTEVKIVRSPLLPHTSMARLNALNDYEIIGNSLDDNLDRIIQSIKKQP